MSNPFFSPLKDEDSPFPHYAQVGDGVALSAEIGLLPSLPRRKWLKLLNSTLPVAMPALPESAVVYTARTESRFGYEERTSVLTGYFDTPEGEAQFTAYLAALHDAAQSLSPAARERCRENLEAWDIALLVADDEAEDGAREIPLMALSFDELERVLDYLDAPVTDTPVVWSLPAAPADAAGVDAAPSAVFGEKTVATGNVVVIHYIDFDEDEGQAVSPDGEPTLHQVEVDRGWLREVLGATIRRTRERIRRLTQSLE
jgi:hypothetical protein